MVLCARCDEWLASEDGLILLTTRNSVWMVNDFAFCDVAVELGACVHNDYRLLPTGCHFCGQEHDWHAFVRLRASGGLRRTDHPKTDEPNKNSERKRLRAEHLKKLIPELARLVSMFHQAGLLADLMQEELIQKFTELRNI